jgi:hypothetical protein
MVAIITGKKALKITAVITLLIVILSIIAPANAGSASAPAKNESFVVMVNSTMMPALDAAVLASAEQYGVPFDRDVGMYGIITTGEGRYYVVEYENYLPLAGGLEVLADDGTRVSNSTQAAAILRSVAWTESIQSLNDTDIATMEIILNNTRNIRNTVTPLTNLSNSLIDTYNLKRSLNGYGITNEFAVGLITGSVNSTNAGYEGAVILINQLNNQLNDFSNATVEVNDRLPGIITGSKQIKNGTGYADEELQAAIVSTASDLGVMQDKIGTVRNALDQMSGVGDFLTTIQHMATGLLTYVPIIGSSLEGFANYLLSITGDYLANVLNLKAYAQTLQDNIQVEQQKLNAVIAEANHKTADLTGSWNARQTAAIKVWICVIGLALLLLALPAALVIAYIYRRKISAFLNPGQEKFKK